MISYVAFAGASVLWGTTRTGDVEEFGLAGGELGDMIGPFPTWTAAAEYLHKCWPLWESIDFDDSADRAWIAEKDPVLMPMLDRDYRHRYARAVMDDLIREVRSPDEWTHVGLDDGPALDGAMEEMKMAAVEGPVGAEVDGVEQDLFWSTHEPR